MPASLLPYRDCCTPDSSPPQSRRGSRLSVQLNRASIVRDHMREPIQSLQRLKNKAFKRRTVSFDSAIGKFLGYSSPNSSFSTSLADMTAGVGESSRFRRPTLSREDAIQQHQNIEFRQRFLALPGELRNQIYDEVITNNATHQSHIHDFHPSSSRFVYHESEPEPRGRTLHIRTTEPQPQNLEIIREGDYIWEELMDRWMVDAEVEMFQVFDVGRSERRPDSHDSLSHLIQSAPEYVDPKDREAAALFSPGKLDFYRYRWIGSCTLNLSFYNVDFNFADAAAQPQSSALYATIRDIAAALKCTIKTANLRIKLSFWPGEYLDKSSRGWAPFFESDEDIEGLWSLLKPLKSVTGVQSIRVKRLRGNALWSRQPNSLYPESPPLVIVEKSGVSIDGWLDWDRGWGMEWDWGVLSEGC